MKIRRQTSRFPKTPCCFFLFVRFLVQIFKMFLWDKVQCYCLGLCRQEAPPQNKEKPPPPDCPAVCGQQVKELTGSSAVMKMMKMSLCAEQDACGLYSGEFQMQKCFLEEKKFEMYRNVNEIILEK